MINIKKYFKIIAVILLPILFLVTVIWRNNETRKLRSRAAGTAVLTVNPANVTLAQGATGSFSVLVTPNGSNISAIELVIDYNPSVIRINGASPGSFFTNFTSQVGQPQTLISNFSTTGRAHYALGFPLGSNFSSSTAGVAATFAFTGLAGGTSPITLVTSGTITTLVSDINAQNALGTVNNGTVTVTGSGGTVPSPTRTRTPTRTPTTLVQRSPTPVSSGQVCTYFKN